MANKKSNNNKGLIIGVCVAVIVAVIAIIAVVIVNNSGINESYFKSDDTKYVLTIESDENASSEGSEAYIPIKMHVVYNYSGDQITGLKYYYEYADDATAKSAADYYRSNSGEEVTEIITNGKYVVITANASQYEGITAKDVKEQIDFIESMKNSNFNDGATVETTESETVESGEGTTVETTTTTEVEE